MSHIADRFAPEGLSVKTKRTQPLVVATVHASTMAADPEAYARACLALAKSTTPPDFQRINGNTSNSLTRPVRNRIKTIVLLGAEEKLVPREIGADAISAGIEGARLHVLKDAGHWPHLEALQETSKFLNEFLYDEGKLMLPAKL